MTTMNCHQRSAPPSIIILLLYRLVLADPPPPIGRFLDHDQPLACDVFCIPW